MSDDLDVAGWNAANPLHPRSGDGRFADRLGSALRGLAEQFGEIVQHEEFGEPDHEHNSHGVMTLHADGTITIASIDEQGRHGVIVHDDAEQAWGELTDSIYTAAGDAPNTSAIMTDDFSEAFGRQLDVSFGTYSGGEAFVGLDSEHHGLALDPENAESFAGQLEELRELQRLHVGGDPTATRPLPSGEHLERRKVLKTEYENQTVVGLVSTPDGIRVRLGVISTGQDETRRWTGGRGKTTLDLDQSKAVEIADQLEEFDRLGRERQKIHDRIEAKYLAMQDAGEDVNWNEADAEERAEAGGSWEDDFDDARIETPWGTVRLTDVGMDDEANVHERHVRVEIWPAGMTEAQYDAGQVPTGGPDWAWPGSKARYEKPKTDLNAKNIKALIKLLRTTFAEQTGAVAKSAGSATDTPGAGRARALKRYWTRGKGLAKWVRSAHPWSTLRRHLAKYIKDPDKLDRTTSAWFHAGTGMWSGERKGKNPLGRG